MPLDHPGYLHLFVYLSLWKRGRLGKVYEVEVLAWDDIVQYFIFAKSQYCIKKYYNVNKKIDKVGIRYPVIVEICLSMQNINNDNGIRK